LTVTLEPMTAGREPCTSEPLLDEINADGLCPLSDRCRERSGQTMMDQLLRIAHNQFETRSEMV
jgi:hypothetical protein